MGVESSDEDILSITPTDAEAEVIGRFALELAISTAEVWRVKATARFPDHGTSIKARAGYAAALATAGMLCIIDAIVLNEPNPVLRMMAFEEVIEMAPNYLAQSMSLDAIIKVVGEKDNAEAAAVEDGGVVA